MCKNDERGHECWRMLCKEYGSTIGTLLHEDSIILEYNIGTTDGVKKRLLTCPGRQGRSGRTCGCRIVEIKESVVWL